MASTRDQSSGSVSFRDKEEFDFAFSFDGGMMWSRTFSWDGRKVYWQPKLLANAFRIVLPQKVSELAGVEHDFAVISAGAAVGGAARPPVPAVPVGEHEVVVASVRRQLRQLHNLSQLVLARLGCYLRRRRRSRLRGGRLAAEEDVHAGGFNGGGSDVARGAGSGSGQQPGKFGEVKVGGLALNGHGGNVVGPGGHLGGGESAEPDPRLLLGLPDFRHPFPPSPHSHSNVRRHGVNVVAVLSGPFAVVIWV
nr:hypothetical protein Iba_chr02dCG13390 [Ipomoea batatas]